jgi:nucleoid-associated protein YgaU
LVAILLLWWWLDRVSMSGDTTSTPPAVEQKDSAHIAAPATTATSTQAPDSAAATQEVDSTAHVAATNNAVAEVPTDNRNIEQRIAEHPQIENGEWWMVGTKTVHTLQQGEDLSKLALHYYGDKRLISYIMRYNHMTPAQASRLFVGAKVEIPELVKRN